MAEATTAHSRSHFNSKLVWIAAIALVAAIAAYFMGPRATAAREPANAKQGKKGNKSGESETPVVAIRARKGNIGVYINALGTVTPINTVTVRSRVDGELTQVLYKEGDLVNKGDLLMEIDPRPFHAQLTQYEGQLLRDQATLANAKLDLGRYEQLLKQNAIPEQQVATQRAAVTQAEGVVQSDQGLIEAVKLNISYSKITAPLTGRVGLRLVDRGNIVHAGDANGLVVITQINPISVLFTLAEDQLPQVLGKLRAGRTLTADAYDREMKNRIAQGQLTTVDNQIDQSTGTVRIRATFDNKSSALFPNQFVNVRLLVEEKRGVVLIPSAAIQRTSTNSYVYVVNPDSTVTMRNITIGTMEGEEAEITSGLSAGDEIVLTGADRLQDGAHVRAEIQGEQKQPQKGKGRAK